LAKRMKILKKDATREQTDVEVARISTTHRLIMKMTRRLTTLSKVTTKLTCK